MAFDLDNEENDATRIANCASKERKEKNMDIEVGEYVRTRAGHFYKITRIDENGLIYWNKIQCGWSMEQLKDIVVKHSKQLIDLIEVGDYVNGREVKHIAMFEGFPDYPELIFVDETHLIPDDTCENDEIQKILTKEQFEANCYKVGGEDE